MKISHSIILTSLFFFISCKQNIDVQSRYLESRTPIILISIDGFRWDYFEKTDTPNFDRIIENGVRAEGLIPSYLSKTFPNHLSIVTGSHPNNHGIISNRMYDPIFKERYYIGQGSTAAQDGKWLNREPIWVTVEKQDLRAMTMFWPTSDAEIMGIRPSEWYVYDESITNPQRMEKILSWLDLQGRSRPTFLSTYMNIVDNAGHRYGPDSPEVIDSIIEADENIGILLDGLKARGILEETNIIIVSDHGMASTSSDSVIFLSDYVDLTKLNIVETGPFAQLDVVNDNEIESIYQSLFQVHPELEVYKRYGFPSEYYLTDNPRIQDLTLIASNHWTIIKDRSQFKGNLRGGDHGYSPTATDMHGIFIGTGPDFKKGFFGPRIKNIHLYEMMCSMMNIQPSVNDGNLEESLIFLQ